MIRGLARHGAWRIRRRSSFRVAGRREAQVVPVSKAGLFIGMSMASVVNVVLYKY